MNHSNQNSELLSKTLGLIYPFVIIFGFYIILKGHITPGGGFHGGAILAAVFITRYLILQVRDVKLNALQTIEKFVYIFILLIPVTFLFTMLNVRWPVMNEAYLIAMNVLIGIKVCCGLSIIFFRFVFYESE